MLLHTLAISQKQKKRITKAEAKNLDFMFLFIAY